MRKMRGQAYDKNGYLSASKYKCV